MTIPMRSPQAARRPTVPPDATLTASIAAIEARLPPAGAPPLVVGLCGAQGSGKSTLAAAWVQHLAARGVPVAALSIDDLYLGHDARGALAHDVHPLFATRGVPGTHDVALGLDILARLDRGLAAPIPRFDKAHDDRLPAERWDEAPAGTRVVILEGWCVGARAQQDDALVAPLNDLERDEDPAGLWRRHVNAALAGDYQRLFARIDLLVLLAAPGFAIVQQWRTQQERDLRARTGGGMADSAIARFIAHYERLTRHILAEMPARADLVIALDTERRPVSVTTPGGA